MVKWLTRTLMVVGVVLLANGAYIPVKAAIAQVLLEQAWVKSLQENIPVRPWSWADMVPAGKLSLGDGARSWIVLNTSSGQALAFGPALIQRTDFPNVSVIAAHNDTHFMGIDQLTVGDTLRWQQMGSKEGVWRIVEKRVWQTDSENLSLADGSPMLMLMTCYGNERGANGRAQRLVFSAVPALVKSVGVAM